MAIEDENFYEHDGVDYQAIVRAAVENLEAGEVRQGGSTITQQLARNLYIADPEDTIERKIREAKLARRWRSEHTKDWILEQYLNTASYGTNDGRTAVGVEAASQVYFNKHVSDLNLWEAALLAGLPQAPSEYNPFLTPGRRRASAATWSCARCTSRATSAEEKRNALNAGLGLDRGYRYETIREPYFFSYVEQELIDRYGVNTVRQGGLDVYTTINPRLQAVARAGGRRRASPLSAGPPARWSRPTSRPATSSRWPPRATSRSGSTTSPRRATASRARRSSRSRWRRDHAGVDPDRPTTRARARSRSASATYSSPGPSTTPARPARGTLSLPAATTNSTNVVYAQLGLDLGPENVADMAQRPRDHDAARRLPGRDDRRPRGSASLRSRWRTPTRPSPTVASTTRRPRSSRSSSPTATSTSPTRPTATGR